MKRMFAVAFLLFVALSVTAQDDPDIVPVPVSGLPAGSRVVAYATVQTETDTVLVSEVRTSDGIAAFYLFDYIDHALRARPIGPRSIPADLLTPPTHSPLTRKVGVAGDRYWPVDIGSLTDRNEQLISAPPLSQLRFAQISASPWQLSPPPDSPLVVRNLTVASDGSILEQCVLEPNITAASDRMATAGAWWVLPFGEPHLLVGMLLQESGSDRRAGLRLYNEQRELVATSDPVIEVDANSIPALIRVDLSGDGMSELIFISTAASPEDAVSAFRFVRRDGKRRVLSFNLCSVRMNGPDVVMLQRALEGRGFGVGPHGLDGWYGPDTRAAVIRFQRAAELPVNGVVDRAVWRLLGL